MVPQSLLLSVDPETLRVMQNVLDSFGIGLEVCTDPQAAKELLAYRRFDAIIVDCDNMDGATDVLKNVSLGSANRHTIRFAILGGITSATAAFQMGANFVLDKPLSNERVSRSLRATQGLILIDSRRCLRHKVNIPVSLTLTRECTVEATVTNLSATGLALQCGYPLQVGSTLRASFQLPGTRVVVEAETEVAWADEGHTGLYFRKVLQASKIYLEHWVSAKLEEKEEAEDSARDLAGPSGKDGLKAPRR